MSGTRFYKIVVLTAGLLVSSGCSSLNGAPERIVSTADSINILKGKYEMANALQEFEKPLPSRMSKKSYRDMVVALYMNAIDARYYDFRSELASEGRASSIGFDLAILGLTSGAAIAKESIVNELSAAAAGFAGAKTAIDKNLYFDQTLPAILAAMDTERLKVRKRIVDKLRLEPTEYPLASAFADISAYEMAGSLDRAISNVTSSASIERQQANEEYEKALERAKTACVSDVDLRPGRTSITNTLVDLRDGTSGGIGNFSSLSDEKKFAIIAQINSTFGRTTQFQEGSSVAGEISELRHYFATTEFCSKDSLDAAFEKIKSILTANSVSVETTTADPTPPGNAS